MRRPKTRGSVDYPSTRGIQVDVGLPDATSENRAESPLYGELYPNTIPAYPVPNSSIYTIYLIVTRVQMFYSHTTYIKIREILIHVDIVKPKPQSSFSSNLSL